MKPLTNKVTINTEKCAGCMMCVEVCFLGNFEKGQDGRSRVREGETTCISCGHCAAICPQEAVTVSELDPASFEPIEDDLEMTYDRLLALLKRRRSRREFLDREVEPDKVDKLICAAAQSPSALNRRTVEYAAITEPEVISAISERAVDFLRQSVRMMKNPVGRLMLRLILKSAFNDIEKMLPEMEDVIRSSDRGRDAILYHAPLVLMLHAPKDDTMAAENSVYNAANVLLAAETLGLGACVIGFATEAAGRDPKIKHLAGIPDNHKVCSTIVVGYPRFTYRKSVVKPEKTRANAS